MKMKLINSSIVFETYTWTGTKTFEDWQHEYYSVKMNGQTYGGVGDELVIKPQPSTSTAYMGVKALNLKAGDYVEYKFGTAHKATNGVIMLVTDSSDIVKTIINTNSINEGTLTIQANGDRVYMSDETSVLATSSCYLRVTRS